MALDNIREKLTSQLYELDMWAELSATSDFPVDDQANGDTAALLTGN